MDDAGGTHAVPEKWATGGLVKVVGRDGGCRRDACAPGKVGYWGFSEGGRKGWTMQAGRIRSRKSGLLGV